MLAEYVLKFLVHSTVSRHTQSILSSDYQDL